ncbi:hypothetical protein LOTGIDRAFT_235524 [Lottia gigantea]|uniref:Tubulin epsilon and delta complex protein 1 domain-containing protein n=1 Tax=Lottia gigantea TaxID=225164 RepID=V4BAZ5_LOTGI|nr:hypothetical protein LOTGIDRAFT_235524 [Lottia gigantea]ESO86149.1 hypothetical protein LOTGIDRAFT_235524 [Lottia gigantea]
MNSVRETIQLLAQIFIENGTSDISAEIFRQAKFNKNEAVRVLWKLLFELIYFCKYGEIDEATIKAQFKLTPEEKCVYVKQELQHLGYLLPDFACLSNHGNTGSRELLLALGWLMCQQNILEKFMQKCSSPLDDDTSIFYESYLDTDNKHSALFQSSYKIEPQAKIQKLLMLNGKLQLNLRRMYALQIQDANLSHKIHTCTNGVTLSTYRNHLTPFEVRLLRYPNHLKKMLELLEKDNYRLQNLLLWKEKEHIFWSWMESVLELKVSEKSEDTVTYCNTVPVYLDIPPNIDHEISTSRKHLVEIILQYEDIIDQLEILWTKKHEDISEQDLDNLLTSINMEIAFQRANLSLSSKRNIVEPKKHPQFILKDQSKKSVRPSKHLAPAFLGGQGDCPGVDINIAIKDIEKRIEDLEHDLLVDQGICKTDMEKMSTSVPNCIFIPPLALKGRF